MALFNPETLGRRSAGAIASEPCVLITILSFSIQELARQHPELMEKIKAVIEERMYQNKVKQG
ncbi:MAG: hypothetical protein H6767_07160 [Candidatus Peribacteria bacterium]|nr:MAG: hypothetical protein H6767_07160 [Candidatus Peribacteria bacterium]